MAITLTARTMPGPSSQRWMFVCAGGAGGTTFVAVSQSSTSTATTQAAYSTDDGVTWQSATMPAPQRWFSVAWNGSIFCAVGLGSQCATSTDGISWTAHSMPATANWCSIASVGSLFLAIDSYGSNSASSTDGSAWTTKAGATCSLLVSNSSYFLAFDQGTSVKKSTDGTSWTVHTAPFFNIYGAVYLQGNGWLAASISGGSISLSGDGAVWSAPDATGASAIHSLVVDYNGVTGLYPGSGTNYVQTPKGLAWPAWTAGSTPDMPTGWAYSAWNGRAVAVVGWSNAAATYLSGAPVYFWTNRIGQTET